MTLNSRTKEQNYETGGDQSRVRVSALVFCSICLIFVVVLLLFDPICILLRVSVHSFCHFALVLLICVHFTFITVEFVLLCGLSLTVKVRFFHTLVSPLCSFLFPLFCNL